MQTRGQEQHHPGNITPFSVKNFRYSHYYFDAVFCCPRNTEVLVTYWLLGLTNKACLNTG